MALRHVARAGASSFTRLAAVVPASASLASSSRVGLDFILPRRDFSSSQSRLYEPKKKELPLRWSPLPPEKYDGDGKAGRPATHLLSVKSSNNNVYLTFSDSIGPLWGSISGGTGKVFKKSKRGEYEAAHQAALKMMAKISDASMEFRRQKDSQAMNIVVVYNGFNGNGRDAVHTAISGGDGNVVRPMIVRVEDHTPIRVGGTRPPKPRRV